MPASQTPVFFLGLFFGALLGAFVVYVAVDQDTAEPVQPPQARQPESPHGAAPSRQRPSSPHGGEQDRAQQSFIKVHFMKKFVSALTKVPDNKFPNPDYEPLLSDPGTPLQCVDCHDAGSLNVEAMLRFDPGEEAAEPYRRQPRFMIPLMQKWVERLNKRHADKLKKPVTCTDCHAIDPTDFAAQVRILPPLMVKFVNALKQRPENKNPAKNWKPLLKDPQTKSMLCATCHGRTGQALEQRLMKGGFDLTRPDDYADNKEFMVHLMEEWVERLNREAGNLLVKAVVCRDCHDTDPRR